MDADRDRWTFAAGIAFVGLAVAGLVVMGQSPSTSDSPGDVAQYFASNRSDAMLGAVLSALGVIFFLGFAAAVANHLRGRGEGLAGGVVLASATALAAVQLVLSALFATLAYSVADKADAGVTEALFDFDVVLGVIAGLAAGLFILAAAKGLRRIGAIPGWLALAGTIISTLHFLRVTTWARDGFWSPSGGFVLLAVGAGLAWILLASVVLVRNAPSRQPSAAAHATA